LSISKLLHSSVVRYLVAGGLATVAFGLLGLLQARQLGRLTGFGVMVTSGTMTHRLKQLEKRGLIGRLPNPDDARSLLVRLSASGKERIEQTVFPHVANEQRLLDKLDPATRQRLEQDLKTWLAILESNNQAA